MMLLLMISSYASMIQEALWQIDPLHQVFQCIHIWQHTYSVPGPNALWHHNGQHSMWLSILRTLPKMLIENAKQGLSDRA
jgi:hypothetical protein